MRKILFALAMLWVSAGVSAAEDAPVEVMVLGTYHFGNPGRDVNNMKADNVLVERRQAELDRVATALLAFKPTRIMVEQQSDAPDFMVDGYRTFTPDDLGKKPNEIVQIGYRMAHRAGIALVQGIDEQPKEGEPDYFPYTRMQQTAVKFGQVVTIDAANSRVQAWLKAFEARQGTASIAELLIELNREASAAQGMDFYYSVLAIGDRNDQSGADLNAMWYLRNAKIFGKLMQASKPGDRVLVIYGAGHSYWLRHFAQTVPGYRDIDAVPYLEKAR